FRVVAVIAHHPVVVHFKGIAVGFFDVDEDVFAGYLHLIVFVHLDAALVQREGETVELYRPALFGDDDGPEVVDVPMIVGQLWRQRYVDGVFRRKNRVQRVGCALGLYGGHKRFDIGITLEQVGRVRRHGEHVWPVRVVHRYIQVLEYLRVNVHAVGGVGVLHLRAGRVGHGFMVHVHLRVYHAQRVAGCALAALDIVFALIHGPVQRRVGVHRVVEHHHVAFFYIAETGQAVVRYFNTVPIGFGVDERH